MAMSPWDFEGADWENPNPCDYRYWDSLLEALQTRLEVITRDELGGAWYWLPSFQLPVMPAFTNHQGTTDLHRLCLTFADALDVLAGYFADPTERDSWQGFPNLLGRIPDTYCQRSDGVVAFSTAERLDCFSNRAGCHYRTLPPVGSPASAYGDWIKTCRNALDMLTLYAPSYVPGIALWAGVDWNDQIPGHASLADARAANDTNLRRYLRVLRSGTPEAYTWPWDGSTYDTSNTHRVTTGGGHYSHSIRNPGSFESYTTSTWRGYITWDNVTVDAFSECTTTEELTLDFGANLWPKDYAIDYSTEELDADMRRSTVNRSEHEPPVYPDRHGVPLWYPHRDIDGEVLLLLHVGHDLRLQGCSLLPQPAAFESPFPAGFQIHRLGRLSEKPTFTIGDADAIPSSTPVDADHREGTRGTKYLFWVLVDYAPKTD